MKLNCTAFLVLLLASVSLGAQTRQPPVPAPAPAAPTIPAEVKPAPAASLPFIFGDFFTTAPTVQASLEGGAGTTILASQVILTTNKSGELVNWDTWNLGYDGDFWAVPSLLLKYKGLDITWKTYYDQTPANANQDLNHLPTFGVSTPSTLTPWGGSTTISSLGFSFKAGIVDLSNTVYYNPNGGATSSYFNEGALILKSGNVEAKMATLSNWDAEQQFLVFGGGFANTQFTDVYFKMTDLFGTVNLKVGGTGENDLRLASIFSNPNPLRYEEVYRTGAQTPDMSVKPNYITQSQIGGFQVREQLGAFWIQSTNTLPLLASYKIGDISIINAIRLPLVTTDFRVWTAGNNSFTGFNNLTLAASMPLGAAKLDFGWDVAFDTPYENKDVLGTYFSNYTTHTATNRVFADFDIQVIPSISLQVGTDLQIQPYQDLQVTPKGTGLVADPFVMEYKWGMVYNLGVETQAELGSGFKFQGGAYTSLGFGKSYQSAVGGATTFDAYLDATYATATHFRMSSLSEGAWLNNPTENGTDMYAGMSPFILQAQVDYALSAKDTIYFRNLFSANTLRLDAASKAGGVFLNAPLTPVGYAHEDKITLGASTVQGNVTLTLEGGYTFLLGLPSSSELNYANEKTWWSEHPGRNAWNIRGTFKVVL